MRRKKTLLLCSYISEKESFFYFEQKHPFEQKQHLNMSFNMEKRANSVTKASSKLTDKILMVDSTPR